MKRLFGATSLKRMSLGLLLLALGASCVMFDASVKRGDQLSEEGRWHEAMLEYEEAAKRTPNNRAIEERLDRAKTAVAIDLATAAARAIEIRRLDRAETLVADAVSIAPDVPQVLQARRMVAGAWAKEAEALLEEDNDVDGAFRAIDRAAAVDADAPGVRTTRNRIRAVYVQSLRDQAAAFEEAGRFAPALAALVRLSKVERTDRSTEERMTNLRSWMYGQAGYSVEISRMRSGPRLRTSADEIVEKISSIFPPEGCPNLGVVRRGAQAPGSRLDGELTSHAFDRSERQRSERHTFQSGTRTIPNPEWPGKVAAAESGARKMNSAIEEVQRLMEEVSRREVEVVVAGPNEDVPSLRRDLEQSRLHLQEARDDVQAASGELTQAQSELDQTPETLEEPVMADDYLAITEVTRSFRVEIELAARDIGSGNPFWEGRSFVGEAKAEASHHRGLEPAGIAPLPLAFEQSDDELRQDALNQMVSRVRDDLGGLCRAHRENLRQHGLSLASVNDIPGATEWLALGIFYDPLGDLESWDVDGRVRRFFQQAWQIDDPLEIIGP